MSKLKKNSKVQKNFKISNKVSKRIMKNLKLQKFKLKKEVSKNLKK